MYCATCGSLIKEELNYCSRCGTRVAKDELSKQSDATVSVLKSLSVVTGVIGFVGLGGLIGLIAILVGNNVVPELITIITTLFLLTTFGICFLLIRQISRLSGTAVSAKKNPNQEFAPEQLNSPVAGQIESPRQPFISVTENTTRTLEKELVK